MKLVFALGIVVIILFVLGIIICAALSKKGKSDHQESVWGEILKFSLQVTAGLLIMLIPLSIILPTMHPISQNEMPVFYTIEDFEIMNTLMTYETSEELNSAISTYDQLIIIQPTEEHYFERSFLYFKSGNFDLACEDLEMCYKNSNRWEYAYDLGVCYSYSLKYEKALKYLREALVTVDDYSLRGSILDSVYMIEAYYYGWFYSLFGA